MFVKHYVHLLICTLCCCCCWWWSIMPEHCNWWAFKIPTRAIHMVWCLVQFYACAAQFYCINMSCSVLFALHDTCIRFFSPTVSSADMALLPRFCVEVEPCKSWVRFWLGDMTFIICIFCSHPTTQKFQRNEHFNTTSLKRKQEMKMWPLAFC